MRRIQVLLALIAVAFWVLITGLAFAGDDKAQGQPFQYLQQQIDELKAQIEAIQLTPGPRGTACWDLNGNNVCDPEDDKNGDSVCDTLDCQGTSGVGCVQAYDANNQRLGVLLGIEENSNWVTIFVQGLNKVIGIWKQSGTALGRPYNDVWFQDGSCSTTPYAGNFKYYDTINYSFSDFLPPRFQTKYFTVSTQAEAITVNSKWTSGNCSVETSPFTADGYRIVEIPKDDIPFNLPVAVPMYYE